MNLKEEVSTETNPIKESKPRTGTDAGSSLSERDQGMKKVDELSEIYKLRISFSSALEASSFTLELSPPPKLKSSLVAYEYTCLELRDTLLVPIASNSTPNPKTQFMSILEEQIEKILNK